MDSNLDLSIINNLDGAYLDELLEDSNISYQQNRNNINNKLSSLSFSSASPTKTPTATTIANEFNQRSIQQTQSKITNANTNQQQITKEQQSVSFLSEDQETELNNNTKDPLDVIDRYEMKQATLDKRTQEYYECEYPTIFGQSNVNMSIETIKFAQIDYFTKLQEKNKRKITCLHVGKNGDTYIGTAKGEVLKFSRKEQIILFNNGQISPVTCMDIRDNFIIIGYYDGCINIFNLQKCQLAITIQDLHQTEVLFVSFFHDIYSSDPFHENQLEKLQEIQFLSCSSMNELMKTTFNKGIFSGIKSINNNYPDLYEYVEIVRRTQKIQEIKIRQNENTIFNNVLQHKFQILQIDNITVFLQAFVTNNAIIILAESKSSQPMIILYEKRSNYTEKYNNMINIDKDQIPIIDFQNDVLLIGWGQMVQVMKLQIKMSVISQTNENIIINQFPLKYRYYINQTNILYCHFIRKNIIFLIDNINTCHIINLMKFAKDPYKYDDNPQLSMSAHVFSSYNIEMITKSRLIKIDKNSQIKSYYSSVQINGEIIYILSLATQSNQQNMNSKFEDCQILQGSILDWDYQLTKKFQSTRDINGQFQILEICLQIYQGKNDSFGDISTFKKELSQYICKNVKESFTRYILDQMNNELKVRYDEMISNPNNNNSNIAKRQQITNLTEKEWQQIKNELNGEFYERLDRNRIMQQYIKYLILTSNLNYMYTQFYDTFKFISHLSIIFYQSFKPYIVLQYIKYIPNEIVYNALFNSLTINTNNNNNNNNNNNYNVINKLILYLDQDIQKDYSYIKRSCNRIELISSFIYISCKIENNFKIPLQSLMSYYQTSDNNSYNYNDQLNESKEQKQNQQLTKSWIGYKLLWYIRRSLSGLVYPNQQMDENQWLEASNTIFEWIFLDGELVKILRIDPDIALQNIIMFFRGYSSDLLLRKESELQKNLSKVIKKQFNIQSDQDNSKDNLKTLIIKYINYTLEKNNLSQECYNYYYLLIAEVKDQTIIIDLETSKKAAQFLIDNPKAHFYHNKDLASEIEYKSRQIIKIIQPYIENKQLKYNDFLQSALNSPFVEVCSYLFRLQDNFESAIKIYLDASFIDIRFKVFSFIKEILESQPNKQSLVIEKVFLYLPKLVEISFVQTRELLEKIQNYDIHAIIKALNGQDQLVFKILQEYIVDQRKKIIEDGHAIPKNEEYLYLYYIKLLVKFQPSEVLKELRTQLYPQDEALKILEEQNHLQGVAYLYSERGNIKGALEIHLKLIHKYLERQDKYHAQREFKEATEILLKNNIRGDEESENNWFFWITSIQRMEQRIPKEMIELQKILEQETFESLVHNVQIKSILQNKDLLPVLGQNASNDSIMINHKIYNTLLTLLKSYTFEQKIFEYSKDILYYEYSKRENISFRQVKKGMKLNFQCSQCQKELIKDITHYYCSHTFCKECARNYCQICLEKKRNTYAVIQPQWKGLAQKHDKYLQDQEEKKKLKEKQEQNNDVNEEMKQKQEERKKQQEKKLIHDRKIKKLKNFDKNISDNRSENHYNFNNW